MSDLSVYVVILTWNQKDLTIECLNSFLLSTYPNTRVVVVDNGSSDGTSEVLRDLFPQITVIHSLVNLGIARGYNLGIEYALSQGADYILVANNDIAVDPAMISYSVEALENDQVAGIVMPKIYYYSDRERLWCTGARWRHFPPTVKMMGVGAKDSPRFSQLRTIEFAPSCCLLIRRQVFETIGYFDTGYFFYNDDWDFSIRARRAGFSILFVPKAKVWHKVSMSTQKSEKPARWWYVLGRSTVRFYIRHFPRALLGFLVWFVIRECVKLKFSRIIPFLAGVGQEIAVEYGWTYNGNGICKL